MSMASIEIFRDFPIINGFVQVPPNREQHKTTMAVDDALVAIPGSEVVRLSQGSGDSTGSKFGQQRWLRLPSMTPSDCCPRLSPDPATELIDD